MDGTQIMTLGLGLEAPWILKDQHLDTAVSPHRLDLTVEAERGSLYSCPECGEACPAHDFTSKTWRHLNFFQHHCYLHARVPRTKCPTHGIKRIEVPWARPGSDFTLLFEQAAMALVREMPVLAAARLIEITDKRLWRIVHHYVGRMLEQLDLSQVKAVGLDETAAKRGHRYVTVFLDMQRKTEPVVFAVPGRGKATVEAFSEFLAAHQGDPQTVQEVVCDMSPAFLKGVEEHLPKAEVTVDWFHIVQIFTRALDEVRKRERREQEHPKHLRWAVLRNAESGNLTANQIAALQELMAASDVFVLSSAWEGFGLVVAEAMACERPVVATDCGGVREVVEDAGFLVPPRNAKALAEAMGRALRLSDDERENLGRAARQRVVERFSLEATAQRYLDVYRGDDLSDQQQLQGTK
ncbi:ISL3 family transposase [Vreelandella subglaciescola]|uniref:Zinc-finger of transposase IS204/IS1001/IS1096/IS1165 n=1 Tax=Vreelandella subglaciescola TaxID=29571 RepID=A0A1M7F8K7_9GAMM|nr:ISL3 family transposase [Halomonas subglaciescola]SHM00381.1 zinc-finger of transposase IS204/IS1001/IS1096/IS1165 [Halomonas subglaciescola]